MEGQNKNRLGGYLLLIMYAQQISVVGYLVI